MDIRVVDMPCVMAENMRGAAMDTTTSADDRLVEMLRSIDESDPQSCDFSPPSSPSVVDSESFVKPGKLSEQQEATEVPQAESHSHSNSHNNKVTLPEAPIQEATQTTSSPALKQRVNIEGVVSSRGPTETSLNNTSYSITSLCLSSRPPEDIDTPIQDIHDIHSHSSTSYLSELPDGLPEVASSLTASIASSQSSVAPATSCASLFFSAPSNMSLSTSFLQSLQSISSTSTCAPSPLSVDGLSALPGCASLPGPLFTCAPSTFTSLMMPVTQTSLMPTLPTEPYSGIGFEGLSLASPVFATLGAKMHEVGKSDTMGVASSSLLHFPDVPISSCDPVTNFTPSVGASMLPLLPQMRSGLGEMEDDRAKNCHKKRDSVSCLGVADSLLLSAPSLIATPATLGTPLPTPKSSAETPATICKAQNQKPFTSVTPRVESSKSFSTKDEAVVIPAAAAASQKPKPALSLAREEKDLLSTPCQNTDLKFSHKVSAHAYTTANPKAVAESVKASGRVQEERAEGRRETQHKEHSLSHEIEAEQKNMESKSKDQTKISSPVLKTEESHSFMLDLTEHPRERKAEQSQENVSQDRRHSKHKEKAFTKEISDADAPQQPKIEKGRSLCSEIPSVMGSSPKADKQNHQKAAEVDETQAAGTSQGVLARHHGGSGTQSDLPALSHPIHVTPSAAVMSKVKDDIAVVASSGMPSQCGDEELLASIAEQELNGQVGGSSMQHSHSGKHEHDTVSSADQYKLTPPLKHLPMQQQQIQKQQQHHQHQQHLQPQPQQEQQKQLQHLQQQQQKPSQHQQQQLQQPQQQQKPPTSQQQLQKQHHHHQQHQQQQQQQQQPKESGGIQNSPASGQNVTSHQVPKYQINHTQVQQQQLQPQQQLHQQHHQQHQQQHHHQPQHPQHVGHHRTPQSHATVSHSQSHINQTPLHKHQQQPTTQQLATQQNPLVQQQPQQITDHSLLTHSSNLVSGITGGLVGEVSTVLGDKGAASQVMQPAQQPGMGLTVPYHPPVVTAPSYMQPPTYDYNTYCRKAPNSPRSEARHQCYGYTGKQHHYQHAEILAPDPNMVTHNTPMLMPGSFLETPEDPTPMRPEPSSEHVRYFSVSHLVNSSEPRKTSVSGQKDNTVAAQPEEKSKELSRSKPGTRKSESKSRTSAGNKNSSQAESHSRRRSPARGSQQSNSGSVPGVMWGNSNSNKSSSAHKQGHNYSTEALLSSQNYSRGTHRSPANQNYTIMTPNQMYQSNYTPQQMKNYVPNTSFGYTSHDRSGQSSCNTDYNFQLHAQPSGSLTYGGNMAYMPTGYPYQNLPSSSTSMLSGDIMAPPHPTGPYPRFPDFPADQSNFPPNPTFPLSLDPQDVCSGGGLMGATSGAMATRAPHTDMQLAPASSVSSSVAYSRSTSNRSSGNGTTTTNLQVGSNHSGANKRSRYGDTNMVGGSMGGAANLLEGGALSHISLHSFTPPCDDPSLVHSNLFPTTAPRHQGNFLLGTDNLMPINTPQYPSSSSSGTAGGSGTATHLGVGGVTGVPGTRSGSSVVLPPGAPGHVPFSPIRMMDRQQVNMAPPPVAPHLSSSLSNFNLTSIIPEIDGKSGESNTGMGSSSSRNVTSNEVVSAASLSSQARLPPMPSSLLPPAESLKSLPSDTNRLPPAMLNNSMNNIFTHTPHHQVRALLAPPLTYRCRRECCGL
ncbi:hypothetical protein GWK47_049483 [Chionoecetes opilio]|uniref:Uncharacterized protein n=1 Tax=Chionoecetes opilio TaxID=41210 RepID=A0A8J4Y493_CHIOP|nr:hypothetical protein GWK47_049483 [Chionoecetes opilio]